MQQQHEVEACCILNSKEGDCAACITRMLSMLVQRLACFAAESSIQHAITIAALKCLLKLGQDMAKGAGWSGQGESGGVINRLNIHVNVFMSISLAILIMRCEHPRCISQQARARRTSGRAANQPAAIQIVLFIY